MEKIKFKSAPFKLLKNVEIKGTTLSFKAMNKNGELINLKNIKGKIKIISSFPKLNTSVCDNQTIKIKEIANKYKNVSFISITMDDIKTINQWCIKHDSNNLIILSDKNNQEFGKTSGLVIPKLKMLARGFIVLNENNHVLELIYKEELTDEPNFKMLEKVIKNYLN